MSFQAVAEESDALSDEANSRVMCHVSSLRGNWSQAFLEKVCMENPSRSKTETHRAAHSVGFQASSIPFPDPFRTQPRYAKSYLGIVQTVWFNVICAIFFNCMVLVLRIYILSL